MELSQSVISKYRTPWPHYVFAVFLGVAAFNLSMMFHAMSDGDKVLHIDLVFMVLSGLIFSVLGVLSMVKDNHKEFGVLCLVVGSVVAGIAPLVFH